MRRAPQLLLLLTMSGCAGRLYSRSTGSSTATPDATYACVETKLKELGYQRKQYDASARWYVGQRDDPKARVADIRFRSRVDRLDVKVRPDASGNAALEIKAQTFDRYDNQRGLDEIEQSASNQVKLDARSLIEACGI